jgi:hypothetical protein
MMIAMNQVVEIQFYPNTPVGSYSVYDWDADSAIEQACAIMHECDGDL